MSPVETIIKHYEAEAASAGASVEECESVENKEYFRGKRDGFKEAAQFLKNLQKLFN